MGTMCLGCPAGDQVRVVSGPSMQAYPEHTMHMAPWLPLALQAHIPCTQAPMACPRTCSHSHSTRSHCTLLRLRTTCLAYPLLTALGAPGQLTMVAMHQLLLALHMGLLDPAPWDQGALLRHLAHLVPWHTWHQSSWLLQLKLRPLRQAACNTPATPTPTSLSCPNSWHMLSPKVHRLACLQLPWLQQQHRLQPWDSRPPCSKRRLRPHGLRPATTRPMQTLS